jgi:hypothetical protein
MTDRIDWDADETPFGKVGILPIRVRRCDILDISITAREGGIGYWSVLVDGYRTSDVHS